MYEPMNEDLEMGELEREFCSLSKRYARMRMAFTILAINFGLIFLAWLWLALLIYWRL